jgi:hypothetical protein
MCFIQFIGVVDGSVSRELRVNALHLLLSRSSYYSHTVTSYYIIVISICGRTGFDEIKITDYVLYSDV